MTKKFTIFRSQSPKLANLDPRIQGLFDKKHSRIVKAQEEEQEEQEKTQEELILAMCEGIVSNAESIKQIIEQGGLSLEEKIEETKDNEKNLEEISKSIEQGGLNGRFVSRKRRIKL